SPIAGGALGREPTAREHVQAQLGFAALELRLLALLEESLVALYQEVGALPVEQRLEHAPLELALAPRFQQAQTLERHLGRREQELRKAPAEPGLHQHVRSSILRVAVGIVDGGVEPQRLIGAPGSTQP